MNKRGSWLYNISYWIRGFCRMGLRIVSMFTGKTELDIAGRVGSGARDDFRRKFA